MSEDLVTWLRVQLDADEETANEEFHTAMRAVNTPAADRSQFTLAEIRAKQSVLDMFTSASQWCDTLREMNDPTAETYASVAGTTLDVIKLLARPYASRHGWQEEWATNA